MEIKKKIVQFIISANKKNMKMNYNFFLFHRKKVLSRGEERKGEEENSSRSGYLPDVRMMWHGQYCEDREIRG